MCSSVQFFLLYFLCIIFHDPSRLVKCLSCFTSLLLFFLFDLVLLLSRQFVREWVSVALTLIIEYPPLIPQHVISHQFSFTVPLLGIVWISLAYVLMVLNIHGAEVRFLGFHRIWRLTVISNDELITLFRYSIGAPRQSERVFFITTNDTVCSFISVPCFSSSSNSVATEQLLIKDPIHLFHNLSPSHSVFMFGFITERETTPHT